MLALLQLLIENLSKALITPLPLPVELGAHRVVAIKDGYSIEELPHGQGAHPMRAHKLTDVTSLAQWCARAGVHPVIFADFNARKFTAVSDDHLWTRDTVTVEPLFDRNYLLIAAFAGQTLAQADLSQALRAVSSFLVDSSIPGRIDAVKYQQGMSFEGRVQNGVQVFAATNNKVDYGDALPAEIVFRVPVYQGGLTVEVKLLVRPSITSSGLIFGLSWPTKDVTLDAAFRGEEQALIAQLEEAKVNADVPRAGVLRGAPSIELWAAKS